MQLLNKVVEDVIQPLALPVVERNLMPDFVIRFAIQRICAERLHTEGQYNLHEHAERVQAFVQELKTLPIAINTPDANEQHYEVPSAFYQVVLGPRLKYSCGLWPSPSTTFEQSEVLMLDLYCERAGIEDGMRVMDLGCGWGSVALHVASKYRKCSVTAVSNSSTQRDFIEAAAAQRGLRNVRVITADVNDFAAEPSSFDRIISIEMFEHMKNYEKLTSNIAGWLKPGGRLFVHIFSHRRYAYHYDKGWMAQTFFTGGTMPSDSLLLYFQRELSVVGHWRGNGSHYSKTCEAWLQRLDRNIDKLRPLLKETYGSSADTKWYVNWRLFFLACSEMFRYDGGEQWIVSHYLFEKKA